MRVILVTNPDPYDLSGHKNDGAEETREGYPSLNLEKEGKWWKRPLHVSSREFSANQLPMAGGSEKHLTRGLTFLTRLPVPLTQEVKRIRSIDGFSGSAFFIRFFPLFAKRETETARGAGLGALPAAPRGRSPVPGVRSEIPGCGARLSRGLEGRGFGASSSNRDGLQGLALLWLGLGTEARPPQNKINAGNPSSLRPKWTMSDLSYFNCFLLWTPPGPGITLMKRKHRRRVDLNSRSTPRPPSPGHGSL